MTLYCESCDKEMPPGGDRSCLRCDKILCRDCADPLGDGHNCEDGP